MKNEKAIVVLSGGQDSTTCLFWALTEGYTVFPLSFDYGQRHKRELESAKRVCDLAMKEYGLERVQMHEILQIPKLRGSSPLTNDSVTLETYTDYQSMDKVIGDRVELTFVPNRNPIFLNYAVNYAVSKGCFTLITGVCQQDNANYPDCRDSYIKSQEATTNLALGIDKFRIVTPLMYLTKAGSINLAKELPGCMKALAYSHTCYAGEYPPCGCCHACTLRAEGFRQAGVADPLIVRAEAEFDV